MGLMKRLFMERQELLDWLTSLEEPGPWAGPIKAILSRMIQNCYDVSSSIADDLPANELIKRGMWLRTQLDAIIRRAEANREDWPEEVR